MFEKIPKKTVDSEIVNSSGQILYRLESVEAPEGWSQNAIDIAVNKYFRKAGISKDILPEGRETSIFQMITRVVNHIFAQAKASGYFLDDPTIEKAREELSQLLVNQVAAFNSPVWFNCGLFPSYGISAKSENYRWDLKKQILHEVENAYEFPQTSACFIQSVKDELNDIFGLVQREAKIFKYGSGTGTNFSKIRSKYEALAGGGESSGLLSFLEVLDRGASATKSGGITRRAAKMVTLDADHPEILDFVSWKEKEEKKAKALLASGYSAGFDGEAYSSVSGQNSNNSVRLPDRFFEALAAGENWQTLARTDNCVIEEFPAQTLWDQIAKSAWACADPGVQFSDTIERWNPCKASDQIYGSNPCSEYMFLDETACNLASINLVKFWQPDQKAFNGEAFEETCEQLFRSQDMLINLSSYPTEAIAKNSAEFRPLGLGITNLGGLLIRAGLVYGERPSLDLTSYICCRMLLKSVETSAKLAKDLGPFARYEENKTSFLEVLEKHRQATEQAKQNSKTELDLNWDALLQRWSEVITEVQTHGVRNSQFTLIAPTGTIGLLMDCDTYGIEPEYSLTKTKTLAGGGEMTLINQSVAPGLRHLGYSEEDVQSCLKHLKTESSFAGCDTISEAHKRVFLCAVPQNAGEEQISADAHLNVMAAAQPFLSGAISKTVNLPAKTHPSEISQIFLRAWQLGLKSVAIYRNGSKGTQPLTSTGINQEIQKDGQ